jgi:hypothetical protein
MHPKDALLLKELGLTVAHASVFVCALLCVVASP